MASSDEIVRDRQGGIRREMDRRGIALKQVSFDSGISYSTLLSYFPAPSPNRQPAVIPMSAVWCLCQHNALPADMLSLLLPAGWLIVRAPEEIDHEEVEQAARDYLGAKGAAHHPLSEAGREIGPNEAKVLRAGAARLRAVAAA